MANRTIWHDYTLYLFIQDINIQKRNMKKEEIQALFKSYKDTFCTNYVTGTESDE